MWQYWREGNKQDNWGGDGGRFIEATDVGQVLQHQREGYKQNSVYGSQGLGKSLHASELCQKHQIWLIHHNNNLSVWIWAVSMLCCTSGWHNI